jgi:tetratricopeptide (TPR) repeat protein
MCLGFPRKRCRSAISLSWLAALLLLAGARDAAAQQAPPQARQRDLDLVSESGEVVTSSGPVRVPRGYALVVGVAEYPNLPPEKALHFTERDAESIYQILISPQGGNFRAQNVRLLTGEKATLANLRQQLEEWLPSVAQEGDRVLIYFAGHGFLYEDRAYLAPRDIDPKNIRGTGYSMDDLGRVVGARIKASHKILLTDACHSGAITPQAEPTQNEAVNSKLLNLSSSMFSLTASRDREQSFESQQFGGGHGVFTYYVVKGLEGEADADRNGTITADELAEYTRYNVRQATASKQTPTSDRGSFDPGMPLAYVPAILSESGGQRPEAFGTLIFESNMDEVEVIIDGTPSGIVHKGKPLRLPGLRPGPHSIKAVRMGYEPDGPREEMVYPGQTTTVTIKILYARRRDKAALEELDKGIELYNKGFESNYTKAVARFEKALAIDSKYSQAALYLGRSYSALFEYRKSEAAYRKALEIDPDYLEARASFGGMLLDTGDFDEAIRQLTRVVARDKSHGLAYAMLAQSYRMKDMYAEAIEAARRAIELNPRNAEPHFFLADSLRLSGKPAAAKPEYLKYLELSDFESSTGEKVVNYWIRGFLIGRGKKSRASQKDIWSDLRSLTYFGLGDSDRLLKQPDAAIEYYSQSLKLDDKDPLTHYALGLALTLKFAQTDGREPLPQARAHFQKVLELNEHLAEAEQARTYITEIDAELAKRN